MPSYIVKLEHEGTPFYLEWSTIVDAPVSCGMTLEELQEYIRNRYGDEGLRQLPDRLARVEATGCSAMNDDLAGLLACNRAGDGETELTKDEIVQFYRPGAPPLGGNGGVGSAE
jgi:hypothetical protein